MRSKMLLLMMAILVSGALHACDDDDPVEPGTGSYPGPRGPGKPIDKDSSAHKPGGVPTPRPPKPTGPQEPK